MKIRNKKTGEIREVSMSELNQYGLGGQHDKLVKYQNKGEVKKAPSVVRTKKDLITNRENVPGDSFTGTMRREALAYLPYFKDAIRYLEKGASYITPDYKSQADRELLFKRHRPVAYPSIFSAIDDVITDYDSKIGKKIPYANEIKSALDNAGPFNVVTSKIKSTFFPEQKQPFKDPEGDYDASEEAWRMTLGLPVKNKYIIPSKYRPLDEKDKTSKYYTLREDMYNKDLLRQKIKELKLKPGQSAFLPSFAPFVNENYMNQKEFSNVDPLQNFKIGVNKNGKMYFYDKYDFDFEPLSKVTRPYEYEFYNEFKTGGQHGGLDRWFAEKWVDIKTGKPCGRQEGENRNYPACRPSKRISSDTPKTASELSSAEKQKFKQEKTSSQRISYNHNRKEYGGENIDNMNYLNYMKSGGNVPTNPSLWSRAKAAAKSKYDVYPSAYANGFAAKWYKSHGGGWRKAEYGMEVMGDGGVPTNPGFVALPEYVQQNIINNMATGGQKMPPELAYARFAAAGNLNQLGRYGYQNGGEEEVYWRTKQPMVNDPSMDAISKVLLQRNQNKNFMQRAAGFGNQNGIPTRYIDGQDPDNNNMSNLLMGFGDNYVSPTIIETFPNFLGNNSTMLRTAPGQLSYQPNQIQEYIKTPTVDIADYFATKGYKRAANDMYGMNYKQGGSVTLNAGGENHRIYVKTTNRGEGEKGHIMVNHPTMDKGMWDTIDLTEKSGATTIAQGVAATKKWHKENPYIKQKGGEKEWYYPKEVKINEGASYYEPATETFYFNPNNNIENPEVVRQHELYHHLQNINGGLQLPQYYAGPLKKPNMMLNGELQGAYYNRRKEDEQKMYDQIIKISPELQFVPRDILYNGMQGSNGYIPGTDDKMYEDPFTAEGDARNYENFIRNGGKPYFKNGGGIPMYGPGGFVAKPTASDSLAVMNSALAVQKYYDNLTKKGWYSKPKVTRKGVNEYFNPSNLNLIEKESLETYTDHLNKPSFYMFSTKSVYPKVTENDIKKKAKQSILDIKNKKPNTYIYKDLAPTEIDEWAPPTLIDMRIKPQNITRYEIKKNDYMVPGGGYTEIMGYDPIAVKPAAMKTAADWAYMQKTYGAKPPVITTPKPPARQTINTTQGQVTGVVKPNKIKGSELTMMINPVRTKDNLERMEMIPYTLNNPKVVPYGELLPIPSKQIVNLTNLTETRTHPIEVYDRRGNFLRTEFMGDTEGVVNPKYIGEHHYAPRGLNSFIDTNFKNGGGIPERYRNMGFTNVGAKKQSTRPGKKWMVLAKKGDQYKVVHGGYKGMQDFKQHHSEQRKENFWSRMGGRNSSKATDPFSPLYWHKRFGTWEYGGQPMAVGGQNVMNPIVKKDNRNWLEYLKN